MKWLVIFVLAALVGFVVGAVVYAVDFQYLTAQQPTGTPSYIHGVSSYQPDNAISLAIPAGLAGFLVTFVLALFFTPRR